MNHNEAAARVHIDAQLKQHQNLIKARCFGASFVTRQGQADVMAVAIDTLSRDRDYQQTCYSKGSE